MVKWLVTFILILSHALVYVAALNKGHLDASKTFLENEIEDVLCFDQKSYDEKIKNSASKARSDCLAELVKTKSTDTVSSNRQPANINDDFHDSYNDYEAEERPYKYLGQQIEEEPYEN
jgi:hypothetical protein